MFNRKRQPPRRGSVPKDPPVADGGSVAPIGDRLKREVPSTGVPTVLAQFAPKAGKSQEPVVVRFVEVI